MSEPLDYEPATPDPSAPPRGWWYFADIARLTGPQFVARVMVMAMVLLLIAFWAWVLLGFGDGGRWLGGLE